MATEIPVESSLLRMIGTLMQVETATAAIGTSFLATRPVDRLASLPKPNRHEAACGCADVGLQ